MEGVLNGTLFLKGNSIRVVQRSPKPLVWVRILVPLQNIKGYDLVNMRCPLKVKMRRFINYLKESYFEMTKKVSWPTWDKLQSSAILVMVASVIFAVVIFIMDYAFQNLMSAIYTL